MRTLFISDLHLSDHHPKILQGFLGFLDKNKPNSDALYILGDFFDAWIGDDDDNPTLNDLKNRLQKFSQSCPIYFIHGNRDFLIGNTFAQATGINILNELTTIGLNDQPVLLMHGDTLCTQDTEYLKFRAMVRNPAWQHQVLSLPLPQRRQMAADLRQKSQSLNAMKAEDIMDVTPAEVERIMCEQQVTILIHGHTHRPGHHLTTLANGQHAERWVLGDWTDERGWCLEFLNGKFELHHFVY
jgi:UDP-2,3-diacylglucosamine hydrolase